MNIDKNTETQLLYRNLLESAHDPIIIINSEGTIEFANKKLKPTFGYAPDELLGKKIEILVPHRWQKKHIENRNLYFLNPIDSFMGSKNNQDLYGLRKDGTEFPVEIVLSPSNTSRGTLVMAIVRDISERKKIENQRNELLVLEEKARIEAEKAIATKNAFLATLSHELRTPLTSILTWSQMLQLPNFDSEKLQRGLRIIEQSAKAQGQLIDDLLDVTRIQSGKLILNLTPIDPVKTLHLAIESVHFLIESKNLTIKIQENVQNIKVLADPVRLQQVFWNLLTNSIKFSTKGGLIEISIDFTNEQLVDEQLKKMVSFKFTDQGKGIKPDFLPQLFTRFTQADSSSSRVHGGLGIGLTIVRDLLSLQKGTVQAESSGEGKGASFTVFLPLLLESVQPSKTNSLSESVAQTPDESAIHLPPIQTNHPSTFLPDLSGLVILVVEDDPTSLEVITESLNSFGAKIISRTSAAEGLAALINFQPDFLVSDIAMPGEDGCSLMRKIRALTSSSKSQIPSLALTAYASLEDKNCAFSAGFNAYMAKPFDAISLGRNIEKMIKNTTQKNTNPKNL